MSFDEGLEYARPEFRKTLGSRLPERRRMARPDHRNERIVVEMDALRTHVERDAEARCEGVGERLFERGRPAGAQSERGRRPIVGIDGSGHERGRADFVDDLLRRGARTYVRRYDESSDPSPPIRRIRAAYFPRTLRS